MKQYNARYRDIFSISGPIALSLLLPQISFIANTLFVAQLGQLPLVIVGLVSIYYLFLTWLGYGLSNGLLVILSRRAGAGDRLGYAAAFQNGLLIAASMAVVLMLSTWFFGGLFYEKTLSDHSVIIGAQSFLKLRIWGLPFLFFNQLINIFLISTGRTRWLIFASIIGNLLTIGADYALIFGHWGFEAIGENGAAYASVLGELGYALFVGTVFWQRRWNKEFQLFTKIKIQLAELRNIIKTSSPLIFQYIFSIGGWQLFYIYMEHLGQPQVAATHILRSALGLMGVGAWAFASTSNTLVSNLLGQGLTNQVVPAVKKILVAAFSYGALISIVLMVFPHQLIGIFTQDANIAAFAYIGITVLWISSVLLCTSTVVFNAVIGTGKTLASMTFEVGSVIAYIVYLTVVVQVLHLRFWYAWTSELVYWGLLLLISSWYFFGGKWKKGLIRP